MTTLRERAESVLDKYRTDISGATLRVMCNQITDELGISAFWDDGAKHGIRWIATSSVSEDELDRSVREAVKMLHGWREATQ